MRQLVCSDCGWKGNLDPDGTMYFGPGGTLSCPACTKANRNPGIEMSHGNVRSVDVPPFKGWLIDHHSRRKKLVHYVEHGKPICGSKSVIVGGEYLQRERWILQWGKKWCPKCEKKLSATLLTTGESK